MEMEEMEDMEGSQEDVTLTVPASVVSGLRSLLRTNAALEYLSEQDADALLEALDVLPSATTRGSTCIHCGRSIVKEADRWVDPAATGDDSVWRETCDSHDTFDAEHEPLTGELAQTGAGTVEIAVRVHVKDAAALTEAGKRSIARDENCWRVGDPIPAALDPYKIIDGPAQAMVDLLMEGFARCFQPGSTPPLVEEVPAVEFEWMGRTWTPTSD